jgi:hypothetical protein
MSLEAWGDEPFDSPISEDRVQEAFVYGAQACREMMARFVEYGGDATTAESIRANWHPSWGTDPGPLTGPIPIDAWGLTEELLERGRARTLAIIAKARGHD